MSSEQEAGRDSGYAIGALGGVFFCVILVILFLIVFVFKAYKTTFQRLILYFILISVLCELTFALQIAVNFEVQAWICASIVYFYLYFPLAYHVYITVVTNCTFLLTLRLLRGRTNLWSGGRLVECFCVVSTIIVPFAFMWLPINDGGFEALNCNQSDRSQDWTAWNRDAIVLNLMVLVMCVNVLFVCVAIFCCICCFVRRRVQNQQTAILLKNLLYYTAINTTMVGINFLSVTYCFYRSQHKTLSTSFADAVNIILDVLIPLIIFISVVFQAILSIRTTRSQSSSHSVEQDDFRVRTDSEYSATNPTSHPINQPSHTYFSTPYTGAFTTVTVSSSDSDDEEKPLITV